MSRDRITFRNTVDLKMDNERCSTSVSIMILHKYRSSRSKIFLKDVRLWKRFYLFTRNLLEIILENFTVRIAILLNMTVKAPYENKYRSWYRVLSKQGLSESLSTRKITIKI